MSIKVLVVEDEGLFRDMLLKVLAPEEGIDVVGAAQNGNDAISLFPKLDADVVLMDIELGGEPNGVEAGHRIRELRPGTGIVILSHHKDRQYVAGVSTEEAAGWSYLLKQSLGDVSALVRAIEGAAAGLVFIDVTVIQGLRPRANTRVSRLSTRQLMVLELMSQAYNTSSIAEKLSMDEQEAGEEIDLIFEKLGISEDGPVHPWVEAAKIFLEETRAG